MLNSIRQPDPLRSSAIGNLYQKHAAAMYTYIRLRVPSQEEAEDILLDIFTAALEHQKFFALSEDEQAAWFRTVTRNKIIDWYRRSKRYQLVDLDEIAEVLVDDEYQAPDNIALRQEEHTELLSAMQQLSHLHQQVLKLRFFGDLRCAEIANIMGKREGTVRVLLSRALNLLRKLYEEQ